jgi:acyl carrier protein
MTKKNIDTAQLKEKLKTLIISELSIEDVTPEELDDNAQLFGDGLGLDSLDAVELVVLLQRHFGIQIKDLEQGRKIFENLDTLAQYIIEHSEDE